MSFDQKTTWQFLLPTGEPAVQRRTADPSPVVTALEPNDVVTICRNGWPSWERVSAHLADALRVNNLQVQFVDVPLGRAVPPTQMEEIADESALVVLGLANCGSCTVATMQNFQSLPESAAVSIAVTERFVDLASSLAPEAPIEVLPHDIEQRSDEDLDAIGAVWASRILQSSKKGETHRAG